MGASEARQAGGQDVQDEGRADDQRPDEGIEDADNQDTMRFTNVAFINNDGRSGGGLYIHDDPTFITGCTFSGNHADEDGGGFYFFGDSGQRSLSVSNSVIDNNTASDDGGGFDTARIAHRVGSRGLGLISMSERLVAVGGRLEITSRPGHGTSVDFELSLEG